MLAVARMGSPRLLDGEADAATRRRMRRAPRTLASALAVAAVLVAPVAASAMVFKYDEFSLPVGANPQSVTASDCNGDGVPDIAAAGFDSNDAVVFHNGSPDAFQLAHYFRRRRGRAAPRAATSTATA